MGAFYPVLGAMELTAELGYTTNLTHSPENGKVWVPGDCSRATGFSQPVHDAVLPGCVVGLRRGLHATYPAPDVRGSALASAPGRHSFASCDSAGCPALPHAKWRAAACHRETSRPFPRWAQRAS